MIQKLLFLALIIREMISLVFFETIDFCSSFDFYMRVFVSFETHGELLVCKILGFMRFDLFSPVFDHLFYVLFLQYEVHYAYFMSLYWFS